VITVAERGRTVHVEHCMGTTFTIDIRDAGSWSEAIDDVVHWLHRIDATFSTYRATSDISRIRRGELAVMDADPMVADVLDRCARMQLAGEAEPGRVWTVGVVDPRDRTVVLDTVSGSNCAVATSGVGERGAHIINPFTGRPAVGGLTSATVVGPRLTEVDAYATAAFVMGPPAIGWIESLPGHEAMVVAGAGAIHCTRGWSWAP
jgi:thiamine biosynthesis lipoprotein